MKELPAAGAAIREVCTAINQLIRGRSNAGGSLTLTASTTTTVVKWPSIASTSQVLLSPRTANAAAALAGCWVTIQPGQFTVNHASTATTDRTFGFMVLGGQ